MSKRVFNIFCVVLLSLLVFSCSEDSVTDPIDDNNNNNNNSTYTFSEQSISGKLQSFSLQTASLIPWSKGAGSIEARVNGDKKNIVGSGTLNSDGTFTLTFNKTLSTSYFTSFAEHISLWGNGVNYSPTDGKSLAQMSIAYVAITNNVETAVSCNVLNEKFIPVQKWYPTVYTADGTSKGNDINGNLWDCTFRKGWNFFGVYFDIPSKGKSKYMIGSTLPANAVWWDWL